MTNKQIISTLKKAKNIAIFAHRDPDPDSCGAMFGLRDFCRKIGVNADVFIKKEADRYLNHIFPLDEGREDFKAERFDLIVFVDIHSILRIDEVFCEQLFLAEAQEKKFLIIDHHIVAENEQFSFKNFKIENIAASSQLIIGLFKEEGLMPTKEAATYLYSGIMGDTDRFLHNNLNKQVFEDAAYLLDCGADVQHVYDFMYRYKTKNNLRMNKFFLDNIKFFDNDRVGYLIVSEKDRKNFKMDIEDVKFFADQIVTIKGVELSFLCYERDDCKGEYKVSMRSVGNLSLIDFSAKMGGGGHPNAAGFQLSNTSKKKIDKMVKDWAKEIFNA